MASSYQVLWTDTAEVDLQSIIDFIANESQTKAQSFLKEVVKYPHRGRTLPEIEHIPHLPFRELIHLHWRLIYQVEGHRVYILAFLDSRRDLEDLLLSRLTRLS